MTSDVFKPKPPDVTHCESAMPQILSKYALIVVAAIAVGVLLNVLDARQHVVDQRAQVSQSNRALASALETALNEKILIIEGIAAVFEADPNLTFAEFSRTAEVLLENDEAVLNLAVAPDMVIDYVYPVQPNEAARGLDLGSRPEFMVAIDRAVAAGRTIIDGPFPLVQGGEGFIARSPVFVDTVEQAESLWGVISLVIDKYGIFTSTGFFGPDTDLAISVEDADGQLVFGAPGLADLDPILTSVERNGIKWTISMAPRLGWAKTSPASAAIWAIVGAFAVVAMLTLRAFDWSVERKEKAETQLMEAVEALEDGFAIYDSDDRLVLCNQRYKEIYKSSADAMIVGERFEDILRHGLNNGQYKEAIGREEEWLKHRLELHKSYGTPMEQRLDDGRWLRVVERRTPSGNTVGFRVDITALKAALEKAESANAVKTNFLNAVSHELRTPLTVVLGYNAFLSNPKVLPTFKALQAKTADGDIVQIENGLDDFCNDVQRFSKQIDASGQHLMTLINGILDLAAIEQGTLKLEREVVSLRQISEAVIQELKPLAEKKGLDVAVIGQASNVYADPQRIKQILFNLIGNAIKFSQTGTVKVRLSNDGETVRAEVEDNGDGLSREEIDVIFSRFGQLDMSTARQHGGVGLGLPISKELAELHGGTLEVQSQKGTGSVFSLKLFAFSGQSEQAA